MWFQKKHSSIAIDAGPASVAVCQLVGARNGARLGRWGVLEDPLRERVIPEPAAPPLERAARLLSQIGCRGRDASLVLKPPDVAFLSAAVPAAAAEMGRAQTLAMLRFEAARQMQCDAEALEIDFWPLPPGNRSGCNVMIAAARRETLERWCAFAEALRLVPRRVDVLPCALLRAAWRRGPLGRPADRAADETLWGVLDIGFSGALLALALGGQCVYVRPLTSGGDAVTLALAEALGVDYRTAEILKRQYRAGRAKNTPADAPPADPPSAALGDFSDVLESVLRGPLRMLAGEIERAFAYAMESYPDALPSGLYLCGGGARLDGLPETLGGLLGIEAARLDPCANLMPTGANANRREADASHLAACVGMALGDFK